MGATLLNATAAHLRFDQHIPPPMPTSPAVYRPSCSQSRLRFGEFREPRFRSPPVGAFISVNRCAVSPAMSLFSFRTISLNWQESCKAADADAESTLPVFNRVINANGWDVNTDFQASCETEKEPRADRKQDRNFSKQVRSW